MNNLLRAWNIFRRKPMALVGLLMLLTVIIMAMFAPALAPYDPYARVAFEADLILAPPNAEHLLGTDDVGKDVLSQIIYGARISLLVGFLGSIMSLLIGTTIGIVAGYYGGRLDQFLMRFVDFLMVIPGLPLMLVIIAVLGRGLDKIILVIGLLYWTYTSRLVRSLVISLKERQYILRVRSLGASHTHIIFGHIFPQVVPLIVAQGVLSVSNAIISESVLSFLGLGDPLAISWGSMLNFAFARAVTRGGWWFLLPPGFAIVWVSLSVILIGTALEEIFNPRLRTHHLFDARKMVQTPASIATLHTDALLSVQNLSIDYLTENGTALHAVEDVSFDLQPGRSIGLVGESGCGKTTVMLALLRLLPESGRITNGQIRFINNNVLQKTEAQMCGIRWADLSIVFQGAMNALNPVRTVESQIIEAMLHHKTVATKEQARIRAAELLNLVGIAPQRSAQYQHQYSGGMRQRAVIAMALACNPKIIIADEPTTALDVMIQAQIIELLKKLRKELNLSLIMVTHDLGVVAEVCDDVLVMYGGKVAEYAPSEIIFNRPEHPYTQRLLQAFPDISNPAATLASIPGVPPQLDALPIGCRFHPRCQLVQPICLETQPHPLALQSGHWVACHIVASAKNGKVLK
jgi:oligopeptide/dipeptide ABC transporter ATP-binding protein